MDRSPEMTAFLAASAEALRKACRGEALRAAETVIGRFGPVGAAGGPAERVPVCDWVGRALAEIADERAGLGAAFAGLEAMLQWKPRAGAEGAFRNGHANAVILGPGGLERRDDVWVGVTVMAPGQRYVDHDHAPEEVYLALSPGEWWNAGMDWTDPGPGGAIYNPPGIRHAMRSGTGPLLALWYLPL
jgi:quercetin dioxygenase-like cupin family protein